MPQETESGIPRDALRTLTELIKYLQPIQLPSGYEIASAQRITLPPNFNFSGYHLILRNSRKNVGFIRVDPEKYPIEIKVVQGFAGKGPQEFSASSGNRGKSFDTVLIDEFIKLTAKAFDGKIPKIAFSYSCLANLRTGNPKMFRRLMKRYLTKPDQTAMAFVIKLSQRRKIGKPGGQKANESQLNAYTHALASGGHGRRIFNFPGLAPIRAIHAARARRQFGLGAKRR